MRQQESRQVYDPKQTSETKSYEYKGLSYTFKLNQGYYFSCDEAMDDVVNYFNKTKGFKLKSIKPTLTLTPTSDKVSVKEEKAVAKPAETKPQGGNK